MYDTLHVVHSGWGFVFTVLCTVHTCTISYNTCTLMFIYVYVLNGMYVQYTGLAGTAYDLLEVSE